MRTEHKDTHTHTHLHMTIQIAFCFDELLVIHISQSSKCLLVPSLLHLAPTYLLLLLILLPSLSVGCDSYHGNRGFGGMLPCGCQCAGGWHPGTFPIPLPSLSREEISVNDIQDGSASQPDTFNYQGRYKGSVSTFLGQVKSHG